VTKHFKLQVDLLSDTTFGRGDGVTGLVDTEIEYETQTGLPFIRGRVLKGLLVEECANLLFALETQGGGNNSVFTQAAEWLFGKPGSTQDAPGHLRVGPARLPEAFRRAVENEVLTHKLLAADVLQSLTAIRRQTAMNDESGAPQEKSLRSSRVALRGLTFIADLHVDDDIDAPALALLGACAQALRRGGVGRNRGRGELHGTLWGCSPDGDLTAELSASFKDLVLEGRNA